MPHFISLVIPQVRIRFQIAPGTGAGLGISGEPFEIMAGGAAVLAGTTDANGEVIVPLPLVQAGGCSIKIFGVDYPITLLAAWDAETVRTGRQQRFDHLGYIHGYQLDTTIDPTADGVLSERTHHSINNFQWDEDIAVDGDPGPITQGRLTTAAGL
ncbi:MAG: peptidoglycan-binding domain-containing protein [Bryobacteraceae bacterium]